MQGEKTLIEYILLGDPSIHPVISSQSSVGTFAVQERQQRRVAGAMMAAGIGKLLPTRLPAEPEEEAKATEVYASELPKGHREPQGVQFRTRAGPSAKSADAVLQGAGNHERPHPNARIAGYYWTGRRGRGKQKQFCF